jgi:hypothetical protein
MLLPIEFVLARITPTWREMVVGLDRGFVQPRDVLTLAHQQLESGEQSAALDDLLELGPSDRLLPQVMTLAGEEPEQEPSDMLETWGELALAYGWHYREAFADPLATVADWWSDFDYPSSWEPLIHYLDAPADVAELDAHRARILRAWEKRVITRFGADMV